MRSRRVALLNRNGSCLHEVVEAAGPPALYNGNMKLPQLHLRDLFWLTLVSAMAAAWWTERHNHTRLKSLESMVTVLKEQGAEFYYEEKPNHHMWGISWVKPIAERDIQIFQLETKVKNLETELAQFKSEKAPQSKLHPFQ